MQNFWADYSWFVIIFFGIGALILGYIGFCKNGLALGADRTILDNLYLTLGLISLNTGAVPPPVSWELQVARFAVPAVTAYTAFLAFTTIFIQQTDRVRLLFIRDQVVICGLGRKGFRLANQFLALDYPVVVVEVDEGNDWIENIRSAGAVVIQGDASDPELLNKLRLDRAHILIAVVGDDGVNAEIAVQAEELSQAHASGCLNCIIHISESRLWHLLREKELQAHNNPHFRLELFNIYNRGAHLMVQENPPWEIKSNSQTPRVLVIGLGKMGQRVVLEIARDWQLLDPEEGDRIDLTLVDREATRKLGGLLTQHHRLEKVGDYAALDLDI
ncbi:MAG: NAD-binding protein, partial [Anaerolineales bacterium]